MAFTMQEVKRKSKTTKDYINQCYYIIYNNNLLTDNIKYALWKYVSYRFSNRQCNRLSAKTLNKMIEDLLEKVCRLSYSNIKLEDINACENSIIYQIKRAINFGATKNLYYEKSDYIDPSNIIIDNVVPPPNKHLSCDEVKDYFKDLMI